MHRYKIAVFPASVWAGRQGLFLALSELFPVDFVPGQEVDMVRVDAALLFGASRANALRSAASGWPCLAFTSPPSPLTPAISGEICFAAVPSLPSVVRGRSLLHGPIPVAALTEQAGDTVAARLESRPLWIQHAADAPNLQLVAVEPPHLPADSYLFEFFKRDDWMRLLPLLLFLRSVTKLTMPPLRACFMFDDPNLHWRSYGHIDYPQLVQQAAAHNYHVSFATVPADGWFTHNGAAALFRENSDRLSLLVHGNNHTRRELAQEHSDAARQALAAQALVRVASIERASGVRVPRVMAAPHGACSDSMAAALLRVGFEAACISRGSIMSCNPGHSWSKSVGLNPAEFLGDGLPVMPRFRLSPSCGTEILLASVLGQPVVPVGHHEDVADGLGLLADLARLINSIEGVQWTDLGSMARSNFVSQCDGNRLYLKMFSRHVSLTVPDGISEVSIERPWLGPAHSERLRWCLGSGQVWTSPAGDAELLPVEPGTQLEVRSILTDSLDPSRVPIAHTPLWVSGRRHLCEIRDRVRPALHRLRRGWRKVRPGPVA